MLFNLLIYYLFNDIFYILAICFVFKILINNYKK